MVELVDGIKKIVKYILIVIGGCLVWLDLSGVEFGILSNEIFYLEKLFELILIVGGGYIVFEFVGIMNGFGVKIM